MASTRINPNGACSDNTHVQNLFPPDSNDFREAEAPLQLPSSLYDAVKTFGEPEIKPRIGEDYQVKLPQLIRECEHDVSHPRKSTDSETRADPDQKFLVGLPVSLTWIRSEERGIMGSYSSSKTKSGFTHSDSMNNNKTEVSIEKSDPGSHLVPGFDEDNWSSAEKDCFLLGLYIFEKDFVKVRRFVGTKEMGVILSYYYGEFYSSPEYRRWSECRKMKSRKGIFGRRIFSGPRQQELLSRLLSRVSEECRNALLEVSKTFGEEKLSLADYIFSLKAMIGTNILVEAVGIGKGKQDLTGMALEPSRSNQVTHMRPEIPMGKACSSLSTTEIIKFLSGNYRLSKARSNDLFWEAVWPRLLARGWHSEQPENQGHVTGSKQCLVFLAPGIKKFSRRKLVKGDQYFDSVTDILSRVAREPRLIELDAEVNGSMREEYDSTSERLSRQNDDDLPTSQRHSYLQPRTPNCDTISMKFTVVDTSLSDGKVRELRTLPSETSNQFISRDHYEDSDEDTPEEKIDESENLQENTQSRRVYEALLSQTLEQENEDYTAPITKCSRILIGCSPEESQAGLLSSPIPSKIESGLTNCCSDAREVTEHMLAQVSMCLDKDPSTSSTRGSSPCESIENPRAHLLIDLNLPYPDSEDGFIAVDLNNGQDIASQQPDDHHHDTLNSDVQAGLEQQYDLNPRRHSTRVRPLTSRAIEAVAQGYLTVNRRRKRKEASSDEANEGSGQ